MPSTQSAPAPNPEPAKQGMSALAKLGIAAVAIIFVGGAAGAVGVYVTASVSSLKSIKLRIEISDRFHFRHNFPWG